MSRVHKAAQRCPVPWVRNEQSTAEGGSTSDVLRVGDRDLRVLAAADVGMTTWEAYLGPIKHPSRGDGGLLWRRALQAMHPHQVSQQDEEADKGAPRYCNVPSGGGAPHTEGWWDTHLHCERKDAVNARCLTMLHGACTLGGRAARLAVTATPERSGWGHTAHLLHCSRTLLFKLPEAGS